MSDMSKLGIGLMARAPEVGKVKTRLGADIGSEKATAVYRDLLSRISDELIFDTRKLCGSQIDYSWFADPAESIPALRKSYNGFAEFYSQVSGDLGERMQAALEVLLQGHDFAALIGADIPDLTAEHIEATLLGLEKHDVVLGPTFDGGYYLIGVREAHGELFRGIPWSATKTFAETVSACKSANLSYHLLEELSDLDVLSDFKKIAWRPHSLII